MTGMSGRHRMRWRRPTIPMDMTAYLAGMAYLVTTMCYLVIRMHG